MSEHRIEDFYDVPLPEILLVGGLHDGKRVVVPDDRDIWLMPDPVSPTLSVNVFPDIPVSRYRFTGSITDDGLRLFKIDR